MAKPIKNPKAIPTFANFLAIGILFQPIELPTMVVTPNPKPIVITCVYNTIPESATYVAVYFTSKYPENKVNISQNQSSEQSANAPGIANTRY